jgi:diguanylate cyclase (GGDEF)-like protein/PAS domain S-box-containing protein
MQAVSRPDFATSRVLARLVVIGVIVVGSLMALTAVGAMGATAVWENGHWTASIAFGTIIAAVGARRASGQERRIRTLFATALGFTLVGEIVYDVQVGVGFSAYPGPADVLFLAMGVPLIAAFIWWIRGRTGAIGAVGFSLDVAVLTAATAAIIVSRYGESALATGGLAGVVMLAYPIMFLAATGFGLMAALVTRLRPSATGGYLMLLGVAITGVAWVLWLERAVAGLTFPGDPVGYLFSVGNIVMGIGAAGWSSSTRISAHYERVSRSLVVGVPLAAAAAGLGLLVFNDWAAGGSVLLGLAVVFVIVLVIARQVVAAREQLRLRTSERATATRLIEAQARYQSLVERIPAVVYIDEFAPNGSAVSTFSYLSPQVEAMLGYTSDELIADQGLWLSLLHDDDRETALATDMDHFATGQPLIQEYRVTRRDGRVIWLRDEATVLREGAVVRLVSHGVLVDITNRKLLEEQLEYQAFHDPLTGLANRALFRDRVEQALRRRYRSQDGLAVLFLDLDAFKTINDSLGHVAGDQLLVIAANRLLAVVRPSDTISRLGGDEFAILLDGADDTGTMLVVAQRILDGLSGDLLLEGRHVTLRASVGVAVAQPHDTVTDLLRNADAAMYRAKSQGRGIVAVFEPGMLNAAMIRLELEAEIRAALAEHQLILVYQPTVDFSTREVVGVEALIRWNHPSRGLLLPAEFIPFAEESDLIVEIGIWVLGEACEQAADWRRQGLSKGEFSMSVNVSARQLARDGTLVRDVAAALERSGLAPSDLTVEVTESAVLEDPDQAVATLAALRARGVRVAIDDFGTGYSSLSQLQKLPVDVLKIDRAFVSGAGSSSETAVTETLVKLGRMLNLKTVAEGIETAAEAAILEALGCNLAQGFYFGRPMAPDELARLLIAGPIALDDGLIDPAA